MRCSGGTIVRYVYLAALLLVGCSGLVRGQTIDWVVYPTWSDGDILGTGTSPQLTVDTTFNRVSGAYQSGHPRFRASGVTISDPDWPFTNTNVPRLGVNTTGVTNYIITHEFTNSGGLPAGGSIAIIDLESAGSSVQFTGFVEGVEVPVVWTVGFFELTGADATFPQWDPNTRTLQGNASINSDRTNFAFFTSDRALDEVRLDVIGANNDGISFSTAAQTISLFPGDYNADGSVDAADYVAWRDNVGASAGTLPNDIDGGTIGPPQYNTWRANFGESSGAGTGAAGESLMQVAVPEPSSLMLLTVVVSLACLPVRVR